MPLQDVLPAVRALSRADRLRLIQTLAQELEGEEFAELREAAKCFRGWSLDGNYEGAQTLMDLLRAEENKP